MTETRAPYDAGQEPDWLEEIKARLAVWNDPRTNVTADNIKEFTKRAFDDIAYLVTEVERLQSLLEAEQRAKWGAEQDV